MFAASGFCALIYEVVWYQLLQLAIGSTSVSLGILLATFMGGLCIGSLWLPNLRAMQRAPMRAYAMLEAGIAVCAVLVELGLPYLDRAYIAGAEHGLPSMLLRGVLAAACMLLPTILMGASLPTILRCFQHEQDDTVTLAYFYGANTFGAVAGCIVAGFVLLRFYNAMTATLFAAAINLAVAAFSLALARRMPVVEPTVQETSPAPVTGHAAGARWLVYLVIALSGATALGAEVVWTRLLSMLLLGTVYVFSIILAVFLLGLAVGQRHIDPRPAQDEHATARSGLGWSPDYASPAASHGPHSPSSTCFPDGSTMC